MTANYLDAVQRFATPNFSASGYNPCPARLCQYIEIFHGRSGTKEFSRKIEIINNINILKNKLTAQALRVLQSVAKHCNACNGEFLEEP